MLRRLITLGCEYSDTKTLERKIILVNIAALLSIITTTAYYLLYLIYDNSALMFSGGCQMLLLPLFSLSLWNNYRGNFTSARWLLFLVAVISVLTAITTGQGTVFNTHFYFMLFAILPIALFRNEEWLSKAAMTSLNMIIYIYLEVFGWPHDPAMELLNQSQVMFLQVMVAASCISCLMILQSINEVYAEQAEQSLQRQAFTDGLTGLYNRRYFSIQLKQKMAQAPLCLLMMDVDHFKQVNDNYGHDAGDQALKHLAEVVTEHLRSNELFARIGGEEFALILPAKEARQRAEKLRLAIASTPLFYKSRRIDLTVSIGVYQKGNGDSEEDIMRGADKALYLAKVQGRDRVITNSAPEYKKTS
ncbi:GGDEF domain-containing protein [Shewanella submarina]|uniref:diguanylate cyclase n=1 Tax=Shewanella submarina TaxID=2016376 RepID=A0ABV7G9G0_9GAMM|nr:GGDEF domain-containing protein [Shewanella submarina]MCL1039270.1 GGDEF domain-containing protein [Shewanella submarina]